MTDDYIAYEINQGDALSDLESICAHLTTDGAFSDATQPRLNDICRWFTLAHHYIAGKLLSHGYDDVQTDEQVVGILQDLNVMEVAIRIELANPVTGIGQPNERFNSLKATRDDLCNFIESWVGLNAMGAAKVSTGSLHENLALSGAVLSRKRSVENDYDYVQPRFKRGFGRNRFLPDRLTADTDYSTASQ